MIIQYSAIDFDVIMFIQYTSLLRISNYITNLSMRNQRLERLRLPSLDEIEGYLRFKCYLRIDIENNIKNLFNLQRVQKQFQKDKIGIILSS